MFTPIVETAIGLFFVYLLLSMICSALLEWIAALLALRAATLFEGLETILCCDNADVVKELYDHPLIKGFSRKSWWNTLTRTDSRPSYISGDVFAKAFLSIVGLDSKPNIKLAAVPTETVRKKSLSSGTQKMLQTFVAYAPDLDALRKNIEDWYNEAMDRVSGWYKRKTYKITLLLALIVAVLANADSIMLVRVFWHDPIVRTAAVAVATDWVKTRAQSEETKSKQINFDELYPSTSDDKPEPPPPPEERFLTASENLASSYAQVVNQLERAKILIGWCTQNNSDLVGVSSCAPGQSWPINGSERLFKLFGILITMLALSQGSPFWFDLLQKLVNIRLAGTAPDEKDSAKRT
jgi:hypothetical protein